MANPWEQDWAPQEQQSTGAPWEKDYTLKDDPSKRALPDGVKPSTAGGGRGGVNPQVERQMPSGINPTDYGLAEIKPTVTASTGRAVQPDAPKRESVLEDQPAARPWDMRSTVQARKDIEAMPQARPEASIQETPLPVQLGMDAKNAISNPAARGVVAGLTGLGTVLPGAIQAGADLIGSDGVADYAGRVARAGAQITDPMRPAAGGDKLAFDIANSITQTAPTLILGLGGGPAMTALFGQSAAQEYTQGRSAGLDGGTAAARAGIMSLAEVIGEKYGGFGEQIKILKGLAAKIPTEELAPIFARQILKEIPGEQLTTLIQFLGDKAGPGALHPEATLADYLQQAGDTLKVTIGQTAVMGGAPVAINAARQHLKKPADRTPQIKALRAQGDEVAAAHMEQRQQKEQAAYSADREAGALSDFGPELAQRYRETRMTGATAGSAVVQTAARWNFEQAAQVAGLTPKAQQAIADAMTQLPPEKVPGFIQKAITGLVNAGHAQPFDGMEQIAANIETQRDQMLDSVLGAMDDINQLEAQQDGTQDTHQAETAVDTTATSEPGAGAPAVPGSLEQGAESALNSEWQQFPQETETLGVPRSEMPQVKTAHRGAMVNFMNARGVTHEQVEVDPADLKPTQAEFSQTKVQEAADRDTDRSILISSDGYIIDGHHQAVAKLQNGKPVRAIRLGATAADLLPLVHEFPSSTTEQSDVQNTPQATTGAAVTTEAATTGEETPAGEAPAGSDGAAVAGVPAAGRGSDAQTDGVTGTEQKAEANGFSSAESAQSAFLGQNSQPMSDGGKPFKTQAAAKKEKKLHPTMRVVKAKDGKGYVLAPKTAKQIAAMENAAKNIKGVSTGQSGPMSLHHFILSRGGLSRDSMADAGFDKNQRIGNRWLFSDGGLTLAKMAEAMKEAGFIAEETENAVTEGLRRSLVNPVYTPEGYEAMAQAEAETQFSDHLAAQQESEEDPFATLTDDVFTPEDFDGTGFDQASPDIQAEVAALAAHLETIGQDVDSIRERVALQYPDASEQDYHEHLKAAITAAIAEAAQPAGRGDSGQVDGEQDQARELRGESVDRQPASGRSEESAGSERTARDQAPVTIEDRQDGTLAVKGDTKALRERLTAAGIPAKSILASATGVVVGKTKVAKAREVLEAPTLTAPTKSDIEAQQARTEQAAREKAAADRAAERAAAQDEDRKRIAKASEQAADTFELGGDAMENLTGQKDIFGEPADDAKQKAADDLKSALGDLGDIFGKNFRASIAPEQEQKLLPVLSRVMDAAFRLGYLKFKDAAKFTLDKIREALGADVADAISLQHLQGAYVAMSGKYLNDGADSIGNVAAIRSLGELLGSADAGVQTESAQVRPDGFMADANGSANGRAAKTTGMHGYSPTEINALRSMNSLMLRIGKDRKVIDSVVSLIPVDVVDVLAGEQLSPQDLFNDQSVFVDLAGIGGNPPVASRIDAARSVVQAAASFAAEPTSPGNLGWGQGDFDSALKALDDRHAAIVRESLADGNKKTQYSGTQENRNAASTNERVERDSGKPAAVPAVGNPVPGDTRDTAGAAGEAGGQAADGQGGRQPGLTRVQADGTPAGRERGDQRVSDRVRQAGIAEFDAGADFSERGGDAGIDGVPTSSIPASEVASTAVRGDEDLKARAKQREADKTPIKTGDIDNIRATLPYLLEGQQDDVLKTEQRFAIPDGYGMLFTNGTGTGKTFTGLGVVKRFARQGKTNTLIVVPDDKIAADWIESARALGLTVTRLESTKDAGRGISITTYANLGDNDALATRQWDLVVPDESHSLMQAADGKMTGYLENLRAITMHPMGAGQRYEMLNRDDINTLADLTDRIAGNTKILNNTDTMDAMMTATRAENVKLQAQADKLSRKLGDALEKVREEVKESQGAKRTRAVFLSATPFAYEKTIDWANGYLFDYNEGREAGGNRTRSYNEGDNREQFFMQHFGYTMRYNKLNAPDPRKVDTGLMQRQFNSYLKKRGALSGRMLDVKADYDRRFVLVESAVGNQIDEAIEWIEQKRKAHYEQHKDKKGNDTPPNGYDHLQTQLNETLYGKTGHLLRRYLLEAIKAKEVIPIIREHMKMGRKVVVFHDFNKGGAVNPFQFSKRAEQVAANSEEGADALAKVRSYNAAAADFNAKFPELSSGTLLADLASPIERFTREFNDVLLINGNEKKSDLLRRYTAFNDDATGPMVALVQAAKNKGWSGHDTTGKHQRVLFNLGLPTQPTMSIQQEGRIYRTSQVTDAMFRYLNTGTNWERWAFAQTIAERASAAENLGMGELSRALKDSFVAAFEESDAYPPGHEGEGKGGKERDAAQNNTLSEWDRAKSFYWGTQKKNSKTKAQEGTDYFATPEPVGLKMVHWLRLRGGEDTMEPSGGHGAIARWLPDTGRRTVIEPSSALRSRLAMVMNPAEDRILDGQFEDLDIVNKFDGIAMNPPFGSGGKVAIEHVAKAATHLRDGGRIVALIPTGPAADKRFEKWFYETEQRPMKPAMKHPKLGDIYVGDTLTTNAAWAQKGVVISASDRVVTLKVEGLRSGTGVTIEAVTAVDPTGKRTREVRPAEGLHLVADIKLSQVTFERAGTAVATRIVVIEKQTDAARAPGQTSRIDLSDITDIGELFDRIEDIEMPARAMTQAQEDAAKAEEAAPRQPERPSRTPAAKPEKPAKAEVVPTVDRQGAEIVEHVTAKGKTIRGIIRKDLTKEQAQEIDPYTWKKDGGFFIREKYLKPDTEFQRLDDGEQAGDTSADGNTDTRPEARINVELLGRDIARHLKRAGEESSVRPYDARVLPGYGEFQSIAEAFGSEVQGFGMRVGLDADARKRYGFFGGVRTSGVVFLRDTGGDRPHLSVLGHELGHELRSRRPDLYDQLVDAIRPYVNVGKYEAEFVNSVVAKNQTSPDKKQEEFIGEVLSDGFMDPDFWRAMGRKNQSLLQYVGNTIFDLIEKALKAVGYTKRSAPYLNDYKAVMRISGEVMAEFGVAPRGERGELAFQTLAAADDLAGLPPEAKQLDMLAPNVWSAPEPTKTDRVIYELQDGRIDLKRVQEAIKAAGAAIPERFDARLAETLYPGRVATRAQRFLDDEVKPLLEAMARNNVEMDELADYLHARGAKERNAQMAKVNQDLPDGGSGKNSKGVLMTNAAADAHLAQISQARKMALDAMAKRVDAITKGTRQMLVTEGLEKQDTIDAWEKAYKTYVPMFRDEAESGNPHPTGNGMSVRGSSSKRATGSTKQVTNILAHVLMQREAAITRAEKNRVAVSLYGLALSNPNRDFWTTIRPGMKADKIAEELGRMGVDPAVAVAGMSGTPTITTVDPTLGVKVSRPNPIYKSLPGAITVRINGDDRVLMLNTSDPRGARMAENLKNLDGLTKMDIAGSVIGKATRWMASVNTQYNPAFGLVNLIRDTVGGSINLSSTQLRGKTLKVLALTAPALKGIALELSGKKSGEWGRLFRQFQADGGQTGYREQFKDAADRTKQLAAELKSIEKTGHLRHHGIAAKLLGVLDIFNTTLENAVRLAAYREGILEGMSRPAAARLGRELTVDFNRKGRIGREAGPLYAFFNASVQGSARTIETLKGPAGQKIIAGGLTLGVMQAIMLLAAGYDDDEIPEFVKARALIVPLPWMEGKQYLAIPLPLGLHVIPNTGRVLAELTLDGGRDAGSKVFAALGEIAGSFNPLGGGNVFTTDGALKTLAPTVVDPVIELGFNRNFSGTPIEREKFGENDQRPGVERARESTQRKPTGQAYIEISRAINTLAGGDDYEAGKVSPTPEAVRYMAQVVGGGLLRETEKIVNTTFDMARGEEVKPTGVPIFGRLYGEVDDDSVQRTRFYDNLDRIARAENVLNAAAKKGDAQRAEGVLSDRPEVVLGEAANDAKASVAKLNKAAAQTIGDRETSKALDEARTGVMTGLNQVAAEIDRPRREATAGARVKQAMGLSDAR